jgi:hypothetical protein
LVSAGEELDRPGQVAVAGDRAVRGPVQAHQLRQDVRVARVALGARGAVPLPVAGDLQRVDRMHLIARCQQRTHPRAPVGLDPDHHLPRLGILSQARGEQLVQPGDPNDPSRSRVLASGRPAASTSSTS